MKTKYHRKWWKDITLPRLALLLSFSLFFSSTLVFINSQVKKILNWNFATCFKYFNSDNFVIFCYMKNNFFIYLNCSFWSFRWEFDVGIVYLCVISNLNKYYRKIFYIYQGRSRARLVTYPIQLEVKQRTRVDHQSCWWSILVQCSNDKNALLIDRISIIFIPVF